MELNAIERQGPVPERLNLTGRTAGQHLEIPPDLLDLAPVELLNPDDFPKAGEQGILV
jgi:hypothetical protein